MEIDKYPTKKTPLYPEISRYTSYRTFLGDFFGYKKSLRAGFSYRQFATLVGLKSPNYLQLVIQGKRNLTETTGRRLAEALKLSKSEVNYFESLIRLENASTELELVKAKKSLHSALKKLLTRFVEKGAQDVLQKWYYLLIREMVVLEDFEPSGKYISQRLKGIISPEEAEDAFMLLQKSGYLKIKDNCYVQAEPVLDTGIDIYNHDFMQRYHSQLLKTWSTHINKLGYQNQELGVLNIPIPRGKITELQEKIRQFQDEIIGWSQDFQGNDSLVQLGTYLMHFEADDD